MHRNIIFQICGIVLFGLVFFIPCLSNAQNPLETFPPGVMVHGQSQVFIMEGAELGEGKITSEGFISVGREVEIAGSIESQVSVAIGQRSQVEGDVRSGGSVRLELGARVRGAVIRRSADVEQVRVPRVQVDPGEDDVAIADNVWGMKLASGNYRNIFVRSNNVLALVGGRYEVQNIELAQGAQIWVMAPSELIVQGSLILRDRASINLKANVTRAQEFRADVVGNGAMVSIGERAIFHGLLSAPERLVFIAPHARMKGTILGGQVWIQNDVQVQWEAGCEVSEEICDAEDNDCNGEVDEALQAPLADQQLGVCEGTTQVCVGRIGWQEPNYSEILGYEPQETLCDGRDNDCDGLSEESLGLGQACTSGLGVCAAQGEFVCGAQGEVACDAEPLGAPNESDTTCNGIDEDCNGEADEDYVAQATACGQGVCGAQGQTSCDEGQVVDSCLPGEPLSPVDITCDGLDEDCSGEADEDYVAQATACGVGACSSVGVLSCVDGQVQDDCEAAAPVAENDLICDGLDEDCSGEADEDYVQIPTQCGDAGICLSEGVLVCAQGNEVDTCEPHQPEIEACDEIDNDCDGQTDEDFVEDPNHCGGCGIVCTFEHAAGSCQQDACVIEQCEMGWWDVDGDGTNGCETQCDEAPVEGEPFDRDGDRVCDALDNCPLWPNTDQSDIDDIGGLGDACDFVKVTSGEQHNCALRRDGTIFCWGSELNRFQWEIPARLQDLRFKDIDAGYYHNCAVRVDGQLECWGSGQYRRTSAPRQPSDFVLVRAGITHSCAVRDFEEGNGEVICWGQDSYDQASPPADNNTGYIDVDVGDRYSCGLKPDGEVLCWGYGLDQRDNVNFPPVGEQYTSIAIGFNHACSMTNGGSVRCWGNSDDFKLFFANGGYSMVTAGEDHTCVIRSDNGQVRCSGSNREGERNLPEDNQDFMFISAGRYHTCGLKMTGQIVCWGSDGDGRATPPEDGGFVSLSVSDTNSCALKADGEIVCWGSERYLDVPGDNATGYNQVSSGDLTNCGIKEADGEVVCWGIESGGEQTPPEGEETGYISVAPGVYHTCGVQEAEGRAICWGQDFGNGRTVPPEGNDTGYKSVFAYIRYTCGLKEADGSAVCWGSLDANTTPRARVGYSDLSLQAQHGCGLIEGTGELVCWGNNFNGLLSIPANNNTGYISMDTSAYNTCGVQGDDGQILCWGDSLYNQSRVPGENSGFISVGVGYYYACGLKAEDGTIVCWGSNGPGAAYPPSEQAR